MFAFTQYNRFENLKAVRFCYIRMVENATKTCDICFKTMMGDHHEKGKIENEEENKNKELMELCDRLKQLEKMKGGMKKHYNTIVDFNAMLSEKIIHKRFDFPHFYEREIEEKCKNVIPISEHVNIIALERKIKETHDSLSTMVRKLDSEVERLGRKLELLEKQIKWQDDKNYEARKLMDYYKRELSLYPSLNKVCDSNDENYIYSWFNEVMSLHSKKRKDSDSLFETSDESSSEKFSSEEEKNTSSPLSCSENTPQKIETNYKDMTVKMMCKLISNYTQKLLMSQNNFHVMKRINKGLKEDIIEKRNKLPRFYMRIKMLDMHVEKLDDDDEDIYTMKRKLTLTETEIEIKKQKI